MIAALSSSLDSLRFHFMDHAALKGDVTSRVDHRQQVERRSYQLFLPGWTNGKESPLLSKLHSLCITAARSAHLGSVVSASRILSHCPRLSNLDMRGAQFHLPQFLEIAEVLGETCAETLESLFLEIGSQSLKNGDLLIVLQALEPLKMLRYLDITAFGEAVRLDLDSWVSNNTLVRISAVQQAKAWAGVGYDI
jgi:hypothetical protein